MHYHAPPSPFPGRQRVLRVPGLALATVLAILALSLAACDGDDDDDAEPGTTAAATSSATTSTATPTATTGTPIVLPDSAFRALEYPDELTDGMALGDADAPLTVVVYEDFQCPFCLRWTLNYEPLLVNEYVLDGQVRLEFRNLPILGDDSILAARGAHCAAEQDLFWPFHKELFLRQYESGQLEMEQLNIGLFAADQLTAMAVQAGLDDTTFAACLDDPSSLAAVGEDVQEAAGLGFRGTPSFVIGDMAYGSQVPGDAEGWRALLDSALEP